MRFYLGQSWRRLFFCNYIWRVQNKKLTKVDASYEDHLTPTIPNMNTQSFSSSSHILVWVIHWNKKKLLLRISVTCVNSFNKSIHFRYWRKEAGLFDSQNWKHSWTRASLATGENVVIKLIFISITTLPGQSLEGISKQLSAHQLNWIVTRFYKSWCI